MNEAKITPLAKRLAEENGIDWRQIAGSGAEGFIVEKDILSYLARVMAGEVILPPMPEDTSPPPANMPDMAVMAAMLEGIEQNETITKPAATPAPAVAPAPVAAPAVLAPEFELDLPDFDEPIIAPAPVAAVASVAEPVFTTPVVEAAPAVVAPVEDFNISSQFESAAPVPAPTPAPAPDANDSLIWETNEFVPSTAPVDVSSLGAKAHSDMLSSLLNDSAPAIPLFAEPVLETDTLEVVPEVESVPVTAPTAPVAEPIVTPAPVVAAPEPVAAPVPAPIVAEPVAAPAPVVAPLEAAPAVAEVAPVVQPVAEPAPVVTPVEAVPAPASQPVAVAPAIEVAPVVAPVVAAAVVAVSAVTAPAEAPVAPVVQPAVQTAAQPAASVTLYSKLFHTAALQQASEVLSHEWAQAVSMGALFVRAMVLAGQEQGHDVVSGDVINHQVVGYQILPHSSLKSSLYSQTQDEAQGLVALDLSHSSASHVSDANPVVSFKPFDAEHGVITVSGLDSQTAELLLGRVVFLLERPILLA